MPVFTLPDPYDGWTEQRLKGHCRRLGRALDNWQHIAMTLAEHGKDGLSQADRETVERLVEAYRD
ncbi:hypothetical protein ABIE87_006463 [Bradyrhizobium diazoefficiens]|uniref:hypothetical protein n=1 Tax=Bradyrhizobium diazoefficiens TaxID=1355477 RepID=UPI003515E2FE